MATKTGVKFLIQLTEEQKQAKAQILNHSFNFVMGEAGTGKSALAFQIALNLIFEKEVSKIVFIRPAEAVEEYGFLKGSLDEKVAPYFEYLLGLSKKIYGGTKDVEDMFKKGTIEFRPLGFVRGDTFDDCIVLVEEFQNLNDHQFQMLIERLGKRAKYIFTGSETQIDLKYKQDSCVHSLHKIIDDDAVFKCELTVNHRNKDIQRLLHSLRG